MVGDSITAQYNTNLWADPLGDTYAPFFNASTPSRSYANTLADAGQRASFIASYIIPNAPKTLWDELGINDVGQWDTVADFTDAKLAFWDDVRALYPNCWVLAQTMTPQTVINQGDAEAYRQGIRNAAVQRAQTQTVECGTLFNPYVATNDGIHPNDIGGAICLNNGLFVLGTP